MLERILSRENLNRACKRVKANKGAPGIDGMTVEQALPWLREHREELLETMEETEDKDKKSAKDGSTKGLGMASRKQSQRILVCDSYDSGQFSNDKRKTDKQWLL